MCSSTSTDFSKLSLHDFFLHCDDISSDKNFGNESNVGNNLLHYLAWSSSSNFVADACYNDMLNRKSPDGPSYSYMFHSWESSIFYRRSKLIESNNKAYEIATRANPSVIDLEEFSRIDPCFATLFPIKRYLTDHIEMSPAYKGMLPFGKEVTAFYNHEFPKNWEIKGSPTFKDHVRLRNLSNRKSILMGVPTLTINNLMYQFGRMMYLPTNIQEQDEYYVTGNPDEKI